MTNTLRRAIPLLLFAVAAFPAAARADAGTAKAHLDSATALYNLGKFEAAIKEYEASYDAKADPLRVFDIAECYRLASKPEEAIAYYKKFTEIAPTNNRRPEADQKIAQLKQQIDYQKSQQAAPVLVQTSTATTVTRAPEETKPVYKKWWFWTTIGAVVVVGVAVGLGVGLGTQKQVLTSDCRFGVGHPNCAGP